MNRIKLAIFDLDGVITSTTNEHFIAWSKLFKKHFDIDLSPELEVYTRGVSRRDSLHVLLDHYDLVVDERTFRALMEEKNEHYRSLIETFDSANLIEGVLPLIEFLREQGVRIALGSASKNAPMLLKKLGIEASFDFIVDPAGKKGKPDPDIFLSAMRHFDLEPSQCMAFEDAVAGVEAINRAGMFSIGVGDEDLSDADMHIKTFAELPLSKVKTLIQG
jgi:beta-phosphoglucomutase